MKGIITLTATLLLMLMSACIHADQPNDIGHAIQAGQQFLSSRVLTDTYSLACKSSTGKVCVIDKSGKITTGFFITQALMINHQMTESVKNKIIDMVEKERRTVGTQANQWGYSLIGPTDADDTSFALQTLLLLGKDVDLSGLIKFYVASENAYSSNVLRYTTKPATVFIAANNSAIHAEINANVFQLFQSLHQESKINYALIKYFQKPEGDWHSYFYQGRYYSTYMNMGVLCAAENKYSEIDKGLKFILSTQNPDGSWGEPGNPYDTALAIKTLSRCHQPENPVIQKGIAFLLQTQTKDGFWEHSQPIWKYIVTQKPFVIWSIYDNNHVLTTALVVQALGNYQKTTSQA